MIQEANGIRIYYERTGQGAPLILLHGNGEDHTIFLEASGLLAESFTVYALDTRGHGRSSGGGGFHYTLFAEDVAAFIEKLKLGKPLILGFSDGAITALLLGIGHSDMISGIVAAGANTEPKGLTDSAIAEIRKEYEETHSPLLSLMLTEPSISDEDLRRIEVPVLVIAGEHDMVRKEDTLRISRGIPRSKLLILSGEDHASYIHHSGKIARIVLDERSFLEGKAAIG